MAEARDISVAIESAVHDAIRVLAQNVYRQHGIRINSASIDWIDVSCAGKDEHLVGLISANTTTGMSR